MLYRPLGSSNISVSAIGFGAWGIGGRTAGATSYGETDDAVSLRALKTAFDQGVTFYDTANVYGDGHSEELIGEAFCQCRHQVIIATKAGMLPSFSGLDFSPKAIRASLEGSLKRLETDYVDVLQLHNPSPIDLLHRPDVVGELQQLRREGKIRAWGFSTKSPDEALQVLAIPGTACLQVNFNLLDWRAVDNGLFAQAAKAKVAIIARTPLAFGFLTGQITPDTTFTTGDHRSLWSSAKVDAWVTAANAIFEAANDGQNPAERVRTALRFCLSFEAVCAVIPGIMTPAEAVANAAIGDLKPLSDEQLKRIKDAYQDHEKTLAG